MDCLTSDQEALHEKQLAAEGPAALRAAELMGHGPSSFPEAVALLRKAQASPRPGKRIRLALQAASAWSDTIAPLAKACRSGCDACCHIPVLITSAEARILASASGRHMALPIGAPSLGDIAAGRVPAPAIPEANGIGCPFLLDKRCSVYESRPAACRTHLAITEDPLLCQLIPGRPVNVPLADATQIRGYVLMVQNAHEVLADIREFFQG